MQQETAAPRLAFADDFPEETPGLQQDDAGDRQEAAASAAFAEPLLSLEAPAHEEPVVEEPALGARFLEHDLMDEAPTSLPYDLDTRFDDLLGASTGGPQVSAFSHLGGTDFSFPAAEAAPQRAQAGADRLGPARTGYELSANTGPVWAIALLPVVMLVFGLLYLLSGAAGALPTVTLIAIVLGVPYVATVVLAWVDHRRLLRAGFDRPAHWGFALLTAPVYLIARFAAVVRETGNGFAPLMTWVGVGVLLVGSIVAVPGLAVALAPAEFSHQAEQSVANDALGLGATLTVDCPDLPPFLVGGSFECSTTNANGTERTVTVSLQRSNGWIDWRVDDWGAYQTGS